MYSLMRHYRNFNFLRSDENFLSHDRVVDAPIPSMNLTFKEYLTRRAWPGDAAPIERRTVLGEHVATCMLLGGVGEVISELICTSKISFSKYCISF